MSVDGPATVPPLQPEIRPDLPRRVLLGIFFAAIALLLATHTGTESPYTYVQAVFGEKAARLFGVAVNGDAPSVVAVTQFFYEPARIDFRTAHNLHLPLHSFLTATLMSFLHSYFAANYLVNLLAAWLVAWAGVRFGEQAGFSRWPMLVAGLTFFCLPLWPHYLGQPMHYIAGSAINFIVMMTAMALARRGAATPALFGLLTAILTLNYDWYVYGAAMATYVIVARVCRSFRDSVTYAAIALFPAVLWNGFVTVISAGRSSTKIHDQFLSEVLASWLDTAARIRSGPMRPFVVTTVGVKLAIAEIVAMVYWPLIAACLLALWSVNRRNDSPANEAARLAKMIVLWYAVEQIFTAAFDWENNPRRAIPIVFAFGVAYAFAVHSMWSSRVWRAALIVLLAASVCFAFADTLFRSPIVTYFDSGQATNAEPKEIVPRSDLHMNREEMRELMPPDRTEWRVPGAAKLTEGAPWAPFAVAQVAVLAIMICLAWAAARAALVPRWSAAAFSGIWLLSLVVRWL